MALTLLNHEIIEKLPFILGAFSVNAITGSLAADPFSWKILGEKLRDKAIFFAMAIIALHCLCYFPIDGIPLYKTKTSVAGIDIDFNIFATINNVTFMFLGLMEYWSTNANLKKWRNWVIIPPFIEEPISRWLFGWKKE